MIINRDWLFKAYQQEAGSEVAVASADTTPDVTDQGSSILTQDSTPVEENTDTTVTEPTADEAEGLTDGSAGDAGDGSQDAPLDASAFTVPEGMTLDAVMLEQAMPLFKEAGVNQEQSQKLLDLYATKMQEAEQGKLDTFNQLRQDWVKQSKSDSDFGGDKFDESIASAKAALDKFGTPALSKLLDDFGVGDHPEMIRFMVSVGRLTQEDTPGNGARNSAGQKSTTDILYPNS
tara:strand:+ start:15906 stop:16604 length:699 start_codon:yes stop_codon:yes gene_type:complete